MAETAQAIYSYRHGRKDSLLAGLVQLTDGDTMTVWMVKADEDRHHLPPLDARPIAQVLLDGKNLTCTIIHGWDTYRFSIPSQGFKDAEYTTTQRTGDSFHGSLDLETDRFTDGAIFHDSGTVDITLTLDDGRSFTFQMEAVPFRHEVDMVNRT